MQTFALYKQRIYLINKYYFLDFGLNLHYKIHVRELSTTLFVTNSFQNL